MINNRSFAAGASPRPTSKSIISPFAEHRFARFKQTDKPQFEEFKYSPPDLHIYLYKNQSFGVTKPYQKIQSG